MISQKAFILAAFCIIGIFAFLFTHTKERYTPPVSEAESLLAPTTTDRFRWKAETGIEVVNYFSFDCPYCRTLSLKEEELADQYRDAFSLAYRHSPLPLIQPLSVEKAYIGECVRILGGDRTFFDFVDAVFSAYPPEHTDNMWMEDIAEKYVSSESLATCKVVEGKAIIRESIEQSLAHGIYGTPTILVFKDGAQVLELDRPSIQAVVELYTTLSREVRDISSLDN
jgi:thiol-disulfide isomerase/thioredoxin